MYTGAILDCPECKRWVDGFSGINHKEGCSKMSDSDFVDVGDELVVSISGYPVGKAEVYHIDGNGVHVTMLFDWGHTNFTLPLNFKDHDTVDGYGHHSQPLEGIND